MAARVTQTSVLALMLCASAGGAWAQDADRAQERPLEQAVRLPTAEQNPSSQEAVLDEIEVTGSRLQNGDPASKVVVITEEEIKARGVTSVEELIRTLPQNVATIGAISNERLKGPLRGRASPVTDIGALGVSAANLGGLGAGNTLVLVNGRRVAGAAGIEDGFVNLNGIPLSAVERVEITLGGASAVYGADAIGGVINFILKRDYVGSTLSVQSEYSSNDADNSRINLYSGYAWGSGSISVGLDYSRRQPINNYKTGYVTENYSSYYGGDIAFDTRSFRRGLQPGVIDRTEFVFNPDTFELSKVVRGLTLPRGFVGVPMRDDFILVGEEALPDYVPELAGPETESYSASLNFEQKITDRLTVFATGLYNQSENSQELLYDNGLSLMLAPGQAYNPFDAYELDFFSLGTTVAYAPFAEIEAGDLPVGRISNTASNWAVSAGARYVFDDDTRLEVVYNTSRADTSGQSPLLGSVVDFIEDPSAPNGVSCYNFQLAENRVSGSDRESLQAVFDRQCRALTSSDPNLAFNPWKSTADGGGSSVADFFYVPVTEDRQSRVENWEARLNGVLATLPGGKVFYVVGGEYYEDGVDSSEVRLRTSAAGSRDRHAYFGEVTVPIFGEAFNFPFARSLVLSVAARHDAYTTEGPIGTVDGIPVDQGGELIYAENTFERTTPAYGVRWEPFQGLSLRGKWTEGFQPPPHTQLFLATGTQVISSLIFDDPLYTCTTDCAPGFTGNVYRVPLRFAPNPDLRPQTSTQQAYGLTWRPTGALEGLNFDVSYSRTEIDDEFARVNDLGAFLRQEEILQLELFYPRDPATGKIVESRQMIFNISGSTYESVIYDLSYFLTTDYGAFEPRITYLDNLTAERQAFEGTPPTSTLGFLQGPDDYKITASLGWYYHDLSATMWAYYTPSYINDYEVEQFGGVIADIERLKPVDSLLTIDLTAAWQINNKVRLNLAGRNILDEDPPFVVVQGRPYDTARWNAAGRTFSLELQYAF